MRPQDYILLALMVAAYLVYWRLQKRKTKARSRRRRPSNQLTRREQAALRQAQALGFQLEEIHPEVPVTIAADRKSKSFEWSSNLSVARKGKVYLVKVVKGDVSLASAELRRELLLDYLVFQPHGLYLYDGEKEQLQELNISFGSGGGGGDRSAKKELLVRAALIVMIIAGLALLFRLVF
jgi:hypothetical protein